MPAIFIIAAEALSRNLNKMGSRGNFGRYSSSSGCPLVTHLAYADDLLLLSAGDKTTIEMIKRNLECHEICSGQAVNRRKSKLYTHHSATNRSREELCTASGFQTDTTAFLYLGCPMTVGRRSKNLFEPLIQKIKMKVGGWQNKLLSPGGPLYILSACSPSKCIVSQIVGIFSSFFWGQQDNTAKHRWIGWDSILTTKEEGGLGIRKISEMIEAFIIKLWWKVRKDDSLWARYMRAKYLKKTPPSVVGANSGSSAVWRRLLKD